MIAYTLIVLGALVAVIGLTSVVWQIKAAGLGICVRSSMVFGCGLLIALAGGLLSGVGDSSIAALEASRIAAVSSEAAMSMAPGQSRVMELIRESCDAFRAAPSGSDASFAACVARSNRSCGGLSSRVVTDWTGTVTGVSDMGDGRRMLTVRTPTGATLGTQAAAATAIPAGSELFRSAAELTPGTRVVFSGMFQPGSEDCRRDRNANRRDSSTQPDFLFRFTAIRKE